MWFRRGGSQGHAHGQLSWAGGTCWAAEFVHLRLFFHTKVFLPLQRTETFRGREKLGNDNKLSCQGKYWCLCAGGSVSSWSQTGNQKQTEPFFLSARGYFRIKPSQHRLFMSMVCPSLGHPTPKVSKGFISSNYLIAKPPFLKVQQLQGKTANCGEKHRAKCPFFLVVESQGMREQGKAGWDLRLQKGRV